ncbi:MULTISPECIES: branched-chain amino acid ABC transporter permease [unclassified Bosea (in: a-proteobacteria)]|uniref:branched-chain amino acid ABC transporter permease n=1 Tax=unclassified Bosea (in: a-proteobacteria) TaxID=2653178 RepID=UPI000F75E3A1|nr:MULTISPECIES: branched-chain amino acid ABC transporter permease [unclassified Bosea (in: a-proteobacteria)]AZO76650.1 branched-chain amino acid ABC transporter permease [Bosea sp. Tri-49]RXT21482.1 branched-chain amino acid ABC transporter permease [Bosea sp. Tri-39]RXT31821.1 branched-chain amino acid ABC transporter permease [Bosea sp. Tri-54]
MIDLLPHIINGLTLGLLFALIALGFTLIVGVMEVINLAHGSLFAIGAYFALTVIAGSWFAGTPFGAWWLSLPLGLRYVLALALGPALAGLAGMLLELCLRPTYGKPPLYGLLLTFGAALVIEELIRLVWGTGEQNLALPQAINGAFLLNGMIFSTYRFFAAGFSIAAIIAVWLFLERTSAGAVIKAGAHDSEMVRALGYDLARLRLVVFGFGAALAGLAGVVMVPIWGLRPHVGVDIVIPAFLIIVIGGVGSFWGAVIAALLVGLAIGITGAYAAAWSTMSMYLLLIAILGFRSRGLLGRKSALEN